MLGVGFDLDFEYKKGIVDEIAVKTGIQKRFGITDDLDITVREGSSGSQFFFIENFDEYEKETAITYQGNALFDGKTLTIRPKSGLMLPVNTSLNKELMVVYGTGEINMTENKEDKLLVTFRVIQKEEVFIFDSGIWIADENESVKVEVIDKKKYKVTVRSEEDTEVITFKKRT